MRRAQQRHQRRTREVRAHRLEYEVQRRGIRLGRERQRVEGLEGHTRVREHVARQVKVWQRAADDERRAMEGDSGAVATLLLESGGHGDEFLFPIAIGRMHRPASVGLDSRHDKHGSQSRRALDWCRFQVRERRIEPLDEAGRENRLRAEQVDLLESREAGQQVEVGGPEAVRIGEAIGDRDDDPSRRSDACFSDERFTQPVLVAVSSLDDARFVLAIRSSEKRRLLQQARRPPVRVLFFLELVAKIALEILDTAAETAHLVVQRQHLGHERGTHVVRQRQTTSHDGPTGRREQHFTLERRQQPGR
jgi:hypothetical protein